MQNVLLTIHLLATIAMVGVILLQRSEGGVQGLSGGGTGGIISGRGAANVLIRTTMICALVFFITSLVMTRLSSDEGSKPSAYEQELKKVNSSSNILGTPASPSPAPSATTSSAPAPATPDPLAVLTSTPSGLPTAGLPTAAPSASASAPAAPATKSPAAPSPAVPGPSNSPQ